MFLLHPLFYGDPEWAKMACEQKASFLDHYSSMLAVVKIKNMGFIHPENKHMLTIYRILYVHYVSTAISYGS